MLGDLGIEVLGEKGDELVAHCPGHLKRTGRQDRKPSWSINADTGEHHCLSGDTEVLTYDGPVPIRDLAAAGSARLLSSDGDWVQAPVLSFGHQRLWEVQLSRNGVRKTVRATGGHRWVLSRGGERTTETLRPGQRIPSRFPRPPEGIRPDPRGVLAGLVFGDGTRSRNRRTARLTLWGEKAELSSYVVGFTSRREVRLGSGVTGVEFDGGPVHLKDPPDVNACSLGWLLGWLAGFMATDGCVSAPGDIIISSSDHNALRLVRLIADRVGIGSYGISTQWRVGLGSGPTALHHLRLVGSTLPPSFLLRSEHAARRNARGPRRERSGWAVVSARPTEIVEEVFCAVVEGTHAFVLADHVVTGNCFSCGYGGTLAGLVGTVQKVKAPKAKAWLDRFTEESLDAVFRLDPDPRLFQAKARALPEFELQQFTEPPEWALEARQIDAGAANRCGVRWSPQREAWVVPIRDPERGLLWGWQLKGQGSRLFRNLPPGVAKTEAVYGLAEAVGKTVVLVESPLDRVRLEGLGIPAVSSYGASVSEKQMRLILTHAEGLIVALDNPHTDDSGRTNSLRILKDYGHYGIRFWPYTPDSPKDPGDMTDAEILDAAAHTRHAVRGRRAVLQDA